jgi:hypothetical protein
MIPMQAIRSIVITAYNAKHSQQQAVYHVVGLILRPRACFCCGVAVIRCPSVRTQSFFTSGAQPKRHKGTVIIFDCGSPWATIQTIRDKF